MRTTTFVTRRALLALAVFNSHMVNGRNAVMRRHPYYTNFWQVIAQSRAQ